MYYSNDFGTLTLTPVSSYMAVSKIKSKLPEVQANLVSLDTAEKVALITSNRNLQIGFYAYQAYILHHDTPSTCAVCKIEDINFTNPLAPQYKSAEETINYINNLKKGRWYA